MKTSLIAGNSLRDNQQPRYVIYSDTIGGEREMEIWKPVVGYEGFYEVSSYGRVRSVDHYANTGIRHSKKRFVAGHILKLHEKRNGYLAVDLSKENHVTTVAVHRLVAMAFLEKQEHHTQVNHINCDKRDNRVENLEWCTAEENRKHAHNHDLYYNPHKKAVRCKQTQQVFDSSYKAAEWVNATKYGNAKQVKNIAAKIRASCLGTQNVAYGYTWEVA